ncbi:MAG: hypothetical protein KDK65_04780 [Chlamydiia bacterium]|nr:hypothetical protein [Chlamydiia bacterium]
MPIEEIRNQALYQVALWGNQEVANQLGAADKKIRGMLQDVEIGGLPRRLTPREKGLFHRFTHGIASRENFVSLFRNGNVPEVSSVDFNAQFLTFVEKGMAYVVDRKTKQKSSLGRASEVRISDTHLITKSGQLVTVHQIVNQTWRETKIFSCPEGKEVWISDRFVLFRKEKNAFQSFSWQNPDETKEFSVTTISRAPHVHLEGSELHILDFEGCVFRSINLGSGSVEKHETSQFAKGSHAHVVGTRLFVLGKDKQDRVVVDWYRLGKHFVHLGTSEPLNVPAKKIAFVKGTERQIAIQCDQRLYGLNTLKTGPTQWVKMMGLSKDCVVQGDKLIQHGKGYLIGRNFDFLKGKATPQELRSHKWSLRFSAVKNLIGSVCSAAATVAIIVAWVASLVFLGSMIPIEPEAIIHLLFFDLIFGATAAVILSGACALLAKEAFLLAIANYRMARESERCALELEHS